MVGWSIGWLKQTTKWERKKRQAQRKKETGGALPQAAAGRGGGAAIGRRQPLRRVEPPQACFTQRVRASVPSSCCNAASSLRSCGRGQQGRQGRG